MKRLFLLSIALFTLSAISFSGMGMHGKEGGKGGHGHMHMGMMGMMMMDDPEVRRIIREHRKKCMKELMEKLSTHPAVVERMVKMLLAHPETAREVLKNNPELKEQLEELLE